MCGEKCLKKGYNSHGGVSFPINFFLIFFFFFSKQMSSRQKKFLLWFDSIHGSLIHTGGNFLQEKKKDAM